jgi:hypothetical protein
MPYVIDTINTGSINAQTYLRNNIPLGGGFTPITYSELTNLISTSGLELGGNYLITDFRTCYDRPDYDETKNPILVSSSSYVEGPIEPIIVFATSNNTLAIDGYQPTYPNDKIKYDVTYSTTESGGAAFGRITERVDNYNNRTDYDHRTIKFKRIWYSTKQRQNLDIWIPRTITFRFHTDTT